MPKQKQTTDAGPSGRRSPLSDDCLTTKAGGLRRGYFMIWMSSTSNTSMPAGAPGRDGVSP